MFQLRITILFILVVVMLQLMIMTTLAQNFTPTGGCGLTAKFQTGLMNQTIIQMPIWTGENTVIAPGIGLVNIEDGYTDISLMINPRFYLIKNILSSYFGLQLGLLLNIPKKGDATKDIFFGFSYGGEYFIDKYFSLGIEAQLNGTKSDVTSSRFGNPGGMNINTGVAILANLYFN